MIQLIDEEHTVLGYSPMGIMWFIWNHVLPAIAFLIVLYILIGVGTFGMRIWEDAPITYSPFWHWYIPMLINLFGGNIQVP